MDTSSDVLVVGAGFAGLAAALALTDAGATASVLEARDRVGGRVWSSELGNGAVVELGAEWIFPSYTVLHELAARYGLPLAGTGVDYALREGAGPGATDVQAQQELTGMLRSALEAMPEDERRDATVGPFLDRVAGSHGARATLRARFQGTCAFDLDRVSLAMAWEEDLFATGASGPCERFVDGNQGLAEAIGRELDDLRLGHAVDRIEVRGHEVRAYVGDRTFAGRALILAVPAPIAARMPVDPALPAPVAETLTELPMGSAAKFAVATRGRPSPRARQSAALPMWSWCAGGDGGDAGSARECVAAFAGSTAAIEALGLDRGRVAPWLDAVRAMHPDLTLAGEPVVYVWGDDPFTLGAYAAWDPASYARSATLRDPIGPLVLAGEHTAAGGFHGTMEGALRSGRRAAEQVRAILG